MLTLIRFETKKIWGRKLTKIIILGMLFICLLSVIVLTLKETSYDADGTVSYGFEAIERNKDNILEDKGYLTDSKIRELLENYQKYYYKIDSRETINSSENTENNWYSFFYPKAGLYYYIMDTYNIPGKEYTNTDDILAAIPPEESFYKSRKEKVEVILDQDIKSGGLSPAEKTFWMEKTNQIAEPFYYDYDMSWRLGLGNNSSLIFLVIISVCICVSTVFVSEYQTGADAIILTTRYGKTKVIASKVISSFVFALTIYLISLILFIGPRLAIFGTDGCNVPIQIRNSIIPYNWNYLQTILVWIGISFIIMLGLISLNLFLSAVMKSPLPIFVIDMLIMFAPIFMSFSNRNGLWNHIMILMPIYSLDILAVLKSFISYKFGNMILDTVTMITLIYFALSVILLSLVGKVFKKHQVC